MRRVKTGPFWPPGSAHALLAALLFGAAMPASKLLLGQTDPWMLAALLYLGSGLGLGGYRLFARLPRPAVTAKGMGWMAAAILSGGVVAPVLLMFALEMSTAASTSLLLNAEGVFTALLAWLVFREHIGRRIAVGMVLIALGAAAISWPTRPDAAGLLPSALVLLACAAWALDNNFTRRAADLDASWVAAVKGLVAGGINLALALFADADFPDVAQAAFAMVTGLVTYGLSLVLFVMALRNAGAARTGAYFSTAPFVGAVLAITMGEPAAWNLLAAALLMGVGVWLHLTERHEHPHEHAPMLHSHAHTHDDEHHIHDHESSAGEPRAPHVHLHRHEPLWHKHPHFPDAHHLHRH